MEQYYLNTELDNIDNEEWIDIMGFDGIYEVSNYGRVKSVGRWVGANNGGERWVKERILRQATGVSSLIATLCVGGICKRFQVSRLSFFSFNYNVDNLPEYFVMHKNNDWTDNNIKNLTIGTSAEISKNTFEHGKLEHLKDGNPTWSKHNINTAIFKKGKIISKVCINCEERKPYNKFRSDRNECKECTWNVYRKKLGTKKRRCQGIKTTCQLTGVVDFYKNYNDPNLIKFIGISASIRHVKNNTIVKPYLKRHKFNPFRIEEIKYP